MSPSDATNRETRDEWCSLGFYYDLRDEPPAWRFVGSRKGLSRLVSLFDDYVADPRNAVLSEHEHYGPYMYLEVQTAEEPAIDRRGIRGTVDDLARLRDLIAAGLQGRISGESFVIGHEYGDAVDFPLCFEVREDGFDPASADARLRSEPVVGDRVTLRLLPPWVDRLPRESRAVFEFCVGGTFVVREIDDNGLLVLDVAEKVDARFGGSMNDIRVEPRYVEATFGSTTMRLCCWRRALMDIEFDREDGCARTVPRSSPRSGSAPVAGFAAWERSLFGSRRWFALYRWGDSVVLQTGGHRWPAAEPWIEFRHSRQGPFVARFEVHAEGRRIFSIRYGHVGRSIAAFIDPTYDAIDQESDFFLEFVARNANSAAWRSDILQGWQDARGGEGL